MKFAISNPWFVRATVLSLAIGVSAFTFAQDTSQSSTSSGADQSTTKSKKSKGSADMAKGAASDSSQAAGSLGPADKKFVMDAAHGGLAEVQLGQLAASKGTNDQVKQFGQKMVDDHGKANEELKSLAQQKGGVKVPEDLSPADKATLTRLEKLSGAAFDKAYMQHMVADHKKDVAEFKKESQSGKDPDVKAWAGKTLPTLEGHLDMAQKTSAQLGGTKKAKDTSAAQ